MLRNTDLEVNISDVAGKLASTREQRESVDRSLHDDRHLAREERERLNGQRTQFSRTEESLEEQLKLLRDKEQLLRRQPDQWRGDHLASARQADESAGRKGPVAADRRRSDRDWELEIHMPEDRMGHVARARNDLHGDPREQGKGFVGLLHPGHRAGQAVEGKVTDVQPAAEVHGDEGNVVLMHVAIDKNDTDPADLRPGRR